MSDNFDELASWLERINEQLSPQQKTRLNRQISTKMRIVWKNRIKAQKDPDGKRFAPRKRDQAGSIKRGAMFQRLPKMLKTAYSSKHAEIGFAGRTAEVMAVHQFGKTIKPNPNSKPTRYPVRKTIGWSDDDIELIIDEIREFLLNE
ncbi:phage virion morphogenesis protein [Psychrobacter alimentarius]|uniref:phage virion morphogenesis protein n=1 Tax=Psychrobacter TaxID=497 RepID=UPI000BAB1F51|nr:phage virion morphogenesis protein [Psychrobacter sp. JB193]PAT63152.1 phage virion morphogenesis protein [Psychrobacter sp. JB193]